MASTAADDDFSTRSPAVRAVSATTLALCSLFVGFRLMSRFFVVKKPGWDDYAMIVAWLLAFGASFSIIYGTTKGLGRHQQDVPDEWLPEMQQAAYAFSVLYVRYTYTYTYTYTLHVHADMV
jgi:hypothetical protein